MIGAAPLPTIQLESAPWPEVKGKDEAPCQQVSLTGDHVSSGYELQAIRSYLAGPQAEEPRLAPNVFVDSLQHQVWRSAPFLLDQTLTLRDSKAHRLSQV